MVKPMDTGSLLLEAGVFLVSVKLMLMAYKSSVVSAMMQQQLGEIHRAVQRLGATTTLPPRCRRLTARRQPQQSPARPAAEREARRRRMDAADMLYGS